MSAFGADDLGSNPGRTTMFYGAIKMIHKYIFADENIQESNDDDCRWCRISHAKAEEITEVCEKYGFDSSKLMAPLDANEPNQFDYDGRAFHLIIDVPYRTENGNFNTNPMMFAFKHSCVVTVSNNDDAIVNRVLSKHKTEQMQPNGRGLMMKLVLAVTREYQADLKEIDAKRKTVEESIRDNPQTNDFLVLHDLENSLVYLTMSIKSLKLIMIQIQNSKRMGIDVGTDPMFKKILTEIDQAIEMDAIYKDILDSSRNLATTMINNKLNDTMKWLTCATILLTIPMIVTGIYGMNVDLPLQDYKYAFPIVLCTTALVCGAGMLLLKFRKIL